MRTKTLVLLAILAITGLGCKKKVIEVNSDFVGDWSSLSAFEGTYPAYYIIIDSRSAGEYGVQGLISNSTVNGTARIKKSMLKIGVKKFVIQTAPRKVGNVGDIWTMTLDGITYYTDRDSPAGYLYTCSVSFCVYNVGTDTLEANLDGYTYTFYPGSTVCGSTNCPGCESLYSDNKGNSLSYYNIGCLSYDIEVQ